MGQDVLRIIEASYDLEVDDSIWLRRLAEAVYAEIGARHGLSAFYYRIAGDGRLCIGEAVELEMPDGVARMMRQTLESMPPDFVRRSFARCEATTQSDARDPVLRALARESMEAMAAAFGWRDIFMVGGVDPTQHGVYIGAWLPHEQRLDPRRRLTWSRLAVHMVAAHRLRRRLASGDASAGAAASVDAVLTPGAGLEHASGDAEEPEARRLLARAVAAIERARGPLRRDAPEEAVAAWKGLAASKWSLVDQIESDGRRYVLARRNDVHLSGFDELTDRERQVLGYAALGHTNKLIAYEMGISAATVGVHLHRAARKLGTATRAALIEEFVKHGRPSD